MTLTRAISGWRRRAQCVVLARRPAHGIESADGDDVGLVFGRDGLFFRFELRHRQLGGRLAGAENSARAPAQRQTGHGRG